MKEIKLKIDDDVLGRLRSDLSVKMMGGNFAGTIDAFIKKLIDQIDDNYKNKGGQK